MLRRRSFSSLSLDTLASTMPLITQGKAFMGWISICSREMAAHEKQKQQTKTFLPGSCKCQAVRWANKYPGIVERAGYGLFFVSIYGSVFRSRAAITTSILGVLAKLSVRATWRYTQATINIIKWTAAAQRNFHGR